MTEPEPGGSRRTIVQVLKVAAVVAVVGLVVWQVPLGSDEAPDLVTDGDQASVTTRPAPPAQRFSPGELDDEIPLPDGVHAVAGASDGDIFWLVTTDGPPSGTSGTIVRSFEPETAEVRTETELANDASVIVADADGAWATNIGTGELTLIDRDGAIVSEVSLPGDAQIHDLDADSGFLWVTAEDGRVFRLNATTGDVQEVAALDPIDAGQIITELGDVWVMPRSGGDEATRIDPIDLAYGPVSLASVDHDRTFGGFADGEFFVAGSAPPGSVISLLSPTSGESFESRTVDAPLVYLGWIAGSFGGLEGDGTLVRMRPAVAEDERLSTSWDGTTPIFEVDRELWQIPGDGSTVTRVLITGAAN